MAYRGHIYIYGQQLIAVTTHGTTVSQMKCS